MRLEIAERLRCPRLHTPTALVLVAERVVERELVAGVAGCPVCLNEARIRNGDVWFAGATEPHDKVKEATTVDARAEREALDRLIALLMLGEPGGAVLLTGAYARFASPLAAELDVAVVVMEAESVMGPAVCAVHLSEFAVPFSDGTFRAAALDRSLSDELAADAVRATAVGGRVVGALALALPPHVSEVARDQREWLAEREAGPGGVVRIRRA